jgi:hypothetical protein
MTTDQFTYWLQGFLEISDAKKLNEKQVQIIKDHLDLVFNKVTPDRNKEKTEKENPLDNLLDIQSKMFNPNYFNPNHLINIQPNEPGVLCSPNAPICHTSDRPTFEEPQVTVYC